jgi:hypothetical protein
MDLDLKKELENFHCGMRFKELCLQKKKDSATKWAKILSLPHPNQVRYRWKSQNIPATELYLICNELGITLYDFFNLKFAHDIVEEPVKPYSTKIYIEDKIDDLVDRIQVLENALKI